MSLCPNYKVIKSKYHRKLATAEKNAQKRFNSAKKKFDKANSSYHKISRSVQKDAGKKRRKKETTAQYNKRQARLKREQRAEKSAKKRTSRARGSMNKAKRALSKAKGKVTKKNLSDIVSTVHYHEKHWNNQGNCAIYPSDGRSGAGSIVFISPTDGENESGSNNITSWAVDKGAPRSSYSRVNSDTISVAGILTGENGDRAKSQWNLLYNWRMNNRELTYRGDIYNKHLLISNLERDDSTGYVDNLKVTITFTFVRSAEITTAGKRHKKSSKSSKTTRGNRHKKYSSLTIKSGDTLWAISKKYHKSVSWIAKVNHIKNPNRIYPGNKIRVR